MALSKLQIRLLKEQEEIAKIESLLNKKMALGTGGIDPKLLAAEGFASPRSIKFMTGDYLNGWEIVKQLKEYWIRDLHSWSIPAHTAEEQFSSVIRHLFAKYHVPKFLDNCFLTNEKRINCPKSLPLTFMFIAQGDSPRSHFNLTHKEAHIFMNSPADLTIVGAIRRAQILAAGGSLELVNAVNNTFIGDTFFGYFEEFWLKVINVLINSDNLDIAQVSLVLDFIHAKKKKDFYWSIKGRKFNNLLAETIIWHDHLLKEEMDSSDKKIEWNPSGYKPYIENKGLNKNCGWTIKEITNANELQKEGRRQHHCVYSYLDMAKAGLCSIWSMSLNNVPKLTIEVRRRCVVQAKGLCNRSAMGVENRHISIWKTKNGLS